MCEARIVRWCDFADPNGVVPGIDAVFFAASNTQSFAGEDARTQFRERWLGRYLAYDAGHVFVALDEDGAVAGYLAGSFDDPARAERFGDIGYFARLAEVTARYPAHLHVNLAPGARSRGTGSALVAAFVAQAQLAGLPGAHVVTGKGARNVGFYLRLGFLERAVFPWNGVNLVVLGRDLSVADG